MRCGVIELGAETVYQGVYEIKNNRLIRLYWEEEPLGIINYIQDNSLTKEGLSSLNGVLERMKNTNALLKCEENIYFATASLRYLNNREQIEDFLLLQKGIVMHILSGQEEAAACAAGLIHQLKNQLSGTGCDIGGGSTQIFTFSQGKPEELISLPIGGLQYFRMFVHGVLPTREEAERMKQYTCKLLEQEAVFPYQKSRTFYLTGGASKLLSTLNLAYGEQGTERISVKDIVRLIQMLRSSGIQGAELLGKILPNRIHTVLPTLILLETVGEFLRMEEVILSSSGTAEGVLLKDSEKLQSI